MGQPCRPLIGQGRERYDTSDTPPPPAKGFAAFTGDVDPLAARILEVAREKAMAAHTDITWALACLQNSVNVTRRAA